MNGGSFFQRLKQGLTKSRESWAGKIGAIFNNRSWDETSFAEMEETLIAADVGAKASQKLIDALRRQPPNGDGDLATQMSSRLQEAMVQMLQPAKAPAAREPLSVRPWIILFLRVKGVGKNTTIGKHPASGLIFSRL